MATQQIIALGSPVPPARDVPGARRLYHRRTAGLSRKAGDLIAKSFNLYGVDVHITMIYEFDNGAETAMFRSHLNGHGRWWPSLDALKTECGPRVTGLRDLNRVNTDLTHWINAHQNGQQQQQPQLPQQHVVTSVQSSAPQITEMAPELPEDILASTLPFDTNPSYRGMLDYDSSNSSDESQDDYSSQEEDNDNHLMRTPKTQSRFRGYITPRGSPKRYREEDPTELHWPGSSSHAGPSSSPPFRNTYTYANPVPGVASQHGLYNVIPQGTSPSLPLLSQSPSIVGSGSELYPSNSSSGFQTDLSMDQSFSNHMSQTNTPQRVPPMQRRRKHKKNRHATAVQHHSNRRAR